MPGIASSAPAVLIGAVGRRDDPHPRRLGRRDAAQPRAAGRRRAVRHARRRSIPDASTSGSAARPAPTSSPRERCAREATPNADDFPDQLGELGCFLAGEWPDGHPYRNIRAVPHATQQPVIWLLGSSLLQRRARRPARHAVRVRAPLQLGEHAARAAALPRGVPAGRRPGRAVRDGHRQRAVRADRRRGRPHRAAVGAVVPAAAPGPSRSAADARDRRPHTRGRTSSSASSPSAARARRSAVRRPSRSSSPSVLEATRADELMITTMVHDPADRLRSTEFVRELFSS